MAAALRLHTRETVKSALILGFRSLSSRPCMSRGPRLVEGHAPPESLALNWVADFVPDRQEATTLLTWVRCRAKGESWRAFCQEAGWEQSTEDKRRDRVTDRIAAGLNAGLTVPKSP